MMLISIFDNISKEFSPPTIINNEEAAKRLFYKEMTKPENISLRFDYDLYKMGNFDKEYGILAEQVELKPLLIYKGEDIKINADEISIEKIWRK